MTPVMVVPVFIILIPFAVSGLALINTGLCRSRSAAHMMLAGLCVFATAALAYVACGFAWQGLADRPAYAFAIGGKPWNWIAAGPFFLRGLAIEDSQAWMAAWLGMFSAGFAAVIPLGAGAERWRLSASCISSALLAGIVFPLFAHWAWGGGWLAGLGVNYALGRGFVDCGGAGVIHATGGLAALAMAWILGPRRGKYGHEGMPAAIPGHSAVLVLLGCALALVGWLGVNIAGSLLLAGAEIIHVPLIAINTSIAAAAGALAVIGVTRARFGKPDASLAANGWVAGLVACSAGCAFMTPIAAILTGAVAGFVTPFAVELLELRFGIDDPGGSISVHAIGGLWSVMAAGLFGHFAAPDQWVAQLIGVATLLGFMFPLLYALNWLLDRVMRQRAAPEAERQGMDLHELGAGAYPDFMTHFDDMMQR
ncbi:MAG TPA: hypothetical protein VFA04_14470 [Bryobacteraceae bacterium]|nr:hypothetical protein [Bryobacteraceae bacterium]